MGQIPPININTARLIALWVLLIILFVMGWHFVLRQL